MNINLISYLRICPSGWISKTSVFTIVASIHFLIGILAMTGFSSSAATSNQLLVSITPFPFDITPEAVQTVNRITGRFGNLATVQLDNGIAWQAALSGEPFDSKLTNQWNERKVAAGTNPVYLAIAPLAEDRTSWAPAYGGGTAPAWAKDKNHTSAQLKKAYAQFVLRAVEFFHPEYLNIGVEAGDMAARDPRKWPLFEALFTECAREVRAQHPSLKLGISFSLPLLMNPGVLKKVAKVMEASDYVGISFYPYLSPFYAKLGASPLPPPPGQWQMPLEWLASHVTKPVAICETGYSSEPVSLPGYGLKLNGTEELQNEYITNLASFARKDHYLFSVFFLAVDCVPLMKKIQADAGAGSLWTHTGFFDQNLQEKPAWRGYQSAWLGMTNGVSGSRSPTAPNSFPDRADSKVNPKLGFCSSADLFKALPPDEISLAQAGNQPSWMCWKYHFRPDEFSWAVKQVERGNASATDGLKLEVRSDRPEPLLLQVKQAGGGAFFFVLHPGKNWTSVEIPWSEFSPDHSKLRTGKLDPAQIVQFILADASAKDHKLNGRRTVEIANLQYLPEVSK